MALAANSLEGRAMALIERINKLQTQLYDEQDRYKEACAPIREDIKEIWKEAKDAALPVPAMRAYVRMSNTQWQAMAKLTDHEIEVYKSLCDSMGPLGRAAAEKAGVK